MDTAKRMDYILRTPTEEVLTERDLKTYLETGVPMKHYIGFEVSGKIHFGTASTMLKVVDFTKAGVDTTVFLADWHGWINNKLGGDWDNIQKAVKYYKEAFKACIKMFGGTPSKVKFITGSELYHNNDEYWRSVIDVSKNISIGRIMRSITIMGRQNEDLTSFSQLIYPPMQVADIFEMGVTLAHSGMDQRKAHVVARDVAEKLTVRPLLYKRKKIKPVAVHQHLILGLQKPDVWPIKKGTRKQDVWASMKMSKSKPNTAVFVTDSEDEVKKKIRNAFCPEKEIDFNPVIDWAKYLLFRDDKFVLNIKRPDKYGGRVEIQSLKELENIYSKGKLHPLDLKNAVADEVADLLKPVRKHFKDKQDLIKMFDKFEISR